MMWIWFVCWNIEIWTYIHKENALAIQAISLYIYICMDDEAGQWWMDIAGIIGYHSCSWLWWIGARSMVLVLKNWVKVMAPSFQFLILHVLSIFRNKKWHWFNPWWKLIGHIVTGASPKPRITWKAEERATRDAKRDRNKSQLDGNHWRFQHSHQKLVENSLDLFMFVLNFSDFFSLMALHTRWESDQRECNICKARIWSLNPACDEVS